MVRLLVVQVLLLAAPSGALFHDVLAPYLVPPLGGCKPWSEANDQDRYWQHGVPPPGAGDQCAQQGKGNPAAPWSPEGGMGDGTVGHALGSYCVSQRTGQITACTSAFGVPEQVNVQVASGNAVVIAFVTYEASPPQYPPIAKVSSAVAGEMEVEGVTHRHVTNGGRIYYMHFVRVTNLKPRAVYSYAVRSNPKGAWSRQFSFRSPYSEGETRIAVYGDMGVYEWNNMGNLYEEAVLNQTVDLIIHAGDHCYNEGDADERRADGYMQAFEATLANTLWMPVVGNHEFYSGTNLTRYLDSTWEKWGPIVEGSGANLSQTPNSNDNDIWGGEAGLNGFSSATSALGAFLSAGNHHGPGVHASVPSRSSRHFSVNFGLVHLVAFSLNGYNGVDPDCLPGSECDQAQIEWMRKDLAAVDRSVTPWVIAMTHFPMYVTQNASDLDQPVESYAWWAAEECEYESGRDCHPKGWPASMSENQTASETRRRKLGLPHNCPPACPKHGTPGTNVYEPIFYEFGVDLYWAGHVHYYQTFDGPMYNGSVISLGTDNPDGPIHVCTGSGGPPGYQTCKGLTSKTCYGDEHPYSYGRLTVHNATDLTWQQISNGCIESAPGCTGNTDVQGQVIDSWSIHQDKHGPFHIPTR